MVVIRELDCPDGRIIFHVEDESVTFIAQVSLAVNMATFDDGVRIMNRARQVNAYTHAVVVVENGLPFERFMNQFHPFVVTFRSDVFNNHVTVLYTIVRNF